MADIANVPGPAGLTLNEWLRARATGLVGIADPRNAAWLFDDFLESAASLTQPLGWLPANVGTGAGLMAITDEGGGVHQISTGATAASSVVSINDSAQIRNAATAPWYCATRQKITTAVTAASVAAGGLGDLAATKSIAAGFVGPLNAANFVFQYDGLEPAGSIINSGVAVDTAYHVFEMWCLGDSKIHCAIDYGPDLGGVAMAAAAAGSYNGYRVVRNGADAVARTMRSDWLAIMCQRT